MRNGYSKGKVGQNANAVSNVHASHINTHMVYEEKCYWNKYQYTLRKKRVYL